MAITRVKCRAKVDVAGLIVETPFVQSFNVTKQRGQVSTFSASLKVPAGSASTLAGGSVKIWAGEGGADNLIFTGMCRTAKISPCFDDPQYVILSISGMDNLIMLQGKKFTRRCRATDSAWCAITGVTRKGLRSGKFAYNTEPVLTMNDGQLEKQDNVTGTRTDNVVDGNHNTTPSSNNEDESVTILIESFSEPQGAA